MIEVGRLYRIKEDMWWYTDIWSDGEIVLQTDDVVSCVDVEELYSEHKTVKVLSEHGILVTSLSNYDLADLLELVNYDY